MIRFKTIITLIIFHFLGKQPLPSIVSVIFIAIIGSYFGTSPVIMSTSAAILYFFTINYACEFLILIVAIGILK